MPFFERNHKRVLFIHIPKTGGTAIEGVFETCSHVSFLTPVHPDVIRVCPQHFTLTDIELMRAGIWDWAFTVVRNPYQRLESEYSYRKGLGATELDFNEWVLKALSQVKENPFYLDNHLRPMHEFIDERVEVFKFENGLESVIEKAKAHLNLKEAGLLERVNQSKRDQVKWSAKTINAVNKFYGLDFERFEYPVNQGLTRSFFSNFLS
jgi:hypothetical protein